MNFILSARTCLAVGISSFLLVASASFAQTAEEEEVMGVTQAACDAFREGDLAAAERLLAPEFTLVSSTSEVQSREEALAEIRAGDPEYEVFHNHDMAAHVFGDAAIVQGITSLKGRSGGEPFELDVRFTDTLIRLDGEWKLVVSHVTRIPSP